MGATEAGIIAIDPVSKQISRYTHDSNNPNSIVSNDIVSIEVDRSGAVWAASRNSGLSVLDPFSGSITNYTHIKPTTLPFPQTTARICIRTKRVEYGSAPTKA